VFIGNKAYEAAMQGERQ